MTIAVYLAGGSSERLTLCRAYIDRLAQAGVTVTYDWTRDPVWESRPGEYVDLEACARRDMEAVQACDLLWYMLPESKSEGSATEFGIALGLGKKVIASGPLDVHGRIFPRVARYFAEHREAYRYIIVQAMP